MSTRTFGLLLFVWFFLPGCQNPESSQLTASQEKLVPVYVDLLEIQEDTAPSDPAYMDSCRSVFREYNLTEAGYKQILKDLNDAPEKWKHFFSEVLLEIDRRAEQKLPEKSGVPPT